MTVHVVARSHWPCTTSWDNSEVLIGDEEAERELKARASMQNNYGPRIQMASNGCQQCVGWVRYSGYKFLALRDDRIVPVPASLDGSTGVSTGVPVYICAVSFPPFSFSGTECQAND